MSSYVILGIAGLILFLVLVLMNYVMVSKLYSDNPAKKMTYPEDFSKHNGDPSKNNQEPPNISGAMPDINGGVATIDHDISNIHQDLSNIDPDVSNIDHSNSNTNKDEPNTPGVRSEKSAASDQQYRQTLKNISLKDKNPEELINLPRADIEYRQALRSLGDLNKKRP